MQIINKKTKEDVSSLYLQLMKNEISNRKFEVLAKIGRDEWKSHLVKQLEIKHYITCPNCEGHTELLQESYDEGSQNYHSQFIMCDDCNGEGEIELED